MESKPVSKTPRVLLYDIETAPTMAAVWGLWKQNIGLDMIEEDFYLMSFCAKWLDSDEIIYMDCRDDLGNDEPMLEVLWHMMDEADIVIGHNSDKFDNKKVNTRFIMNDFLPPSPYKGVDTLKIAKKHFNFTSNKLAYLTDRLCETKKMSHAKFPGYTLWDECLKGNLEAWEEMKAYNILDVKSLEELYLRLRPFYTSHPVIGIFDDEEAMTETCPHCGGFHLHRRGYAYTNAGKYQRYRCIECGSWSQSRFTETPKEQRELLLKPAR